MIMPGRLLVKLLRLTLSWQVDYGTMHYCLLKLNADSLLPLVCARQKIGGWFTTNSVCAGNWSMLPPTCCHGLGVITLVHLMSIRLDMNTTTYYQYMNTVRVPPLVHVWHKHATTKWIAFANNIHAQWKKVGKDLVQPKLQLICVKPSFHGFSTSCPVFDRLQCRKTEGEALVHLQC